MGDNRAADAFLDRIENDSAGTANLKALLNGSLRFSQPATDDRLNLMAAQIKGDRSAYYHAIYHVSGHDQKNGDPQDDRPQDRAAWMKEQHPRYDAVLARLIDSAFAIGNTEYIVGTLLSLARWALGHEVVPVLETI